MKLLGFIFFCLDFDTFFGAPPWSWECVNDVCSKRQIEGNQQQSLSGCILTCTPSTVFWPHPSNVETLGNRVYCTSIIKIIFHSLKGKTITSMSTKNISVKSNVLQDKVQAAVNRQVLFIFNSWKN